MAGVTYLKSCLEAGRPAILLGAPGSGKTATWQMLQGSLAGQGQKVWCCGPSSRVGRSTMQDGSME